MLRQQTGCFEASKPIEIILSLILLLPPPWRCSARSIRRERQQGQGLPLIQVLPYDASAKAHRLTIRLISPDGSASVKACDWPECQRCDVRCWPKADVSDELIDVGLRR